MVFTLNQILFATLPSRILNILISLGGDGNLLSHVDDIFLPTTIRNEFPFSPFALISSRLFISGLIRYLLGQVVATILILEIARKDRALTDQERGNNQRPLTFRSIYQAIHLIYGTQGLCTFSYAFVMAAVYQVTHYAIRTCLEIVIFRHQLLIPIAYACSSVLLWKLRLIWTCATISAHRPRLSSFQDAHQSKWIHLAVPNFTYGICQALMSEVQGLMQGATISPEELPISTSRCAGTEIFAVIIMLALRLFGLLPASITLILTEASLLPGKFETIIPSPTKKRGSTIVELLGGGKPPMGLAAFRSALKSLSVPQFLWLIELHLKKCFVQIAFEVLTLPIILLGVL